MQAAATCRWAAAIALVFAGLTADAFAGTGTPFTLPSGSPPYAPNGLQLAVSCDWVQGYGHRPVQLELRSAMPVNVDRLLRIEVSLGNWGDSRYVAVSTDMELPAGSRGVSKTLPVPQLSSSQSMTIRTWEDGREIEELSIDHEPITTGQYWGADSSIPRILFVGSTPPDVKGFDFLGSQPYMYGNVVNFSQLKDVFAFVHLKPERLYDQWLFYSGLDLMFLSLPEARTLASQRPEAWRAIAEWTRTGGTLCVYGTGRDPAQLEELEKLLGAPLDEPRAARPNRGWESPTEETFNLHVVEASRTAAEMEAAQAQADGTSTSTPSSSTYTPPTMPAEPPFLWRNIAFGQVVSLPPDDPFPGQSQQWRWLLGALEPSSSRWTSRNGTVPDSDNPQFNELLIADVGLPPIRTYRVLITLFVVLIGPVNYWLLRRAGRLHLFLFTVPLAALLTSLGLLGFALMSDGFVSRFRARSLTVLDQRTSEAATRARLSYYVSLSPTAGLDFSQDTLITPLELTPTTQGSGRTRYIEWNDRQHLTRGWLPARTPTQFTTARSNRSEIGLDIRAGEAGSRAILNRLGVRIHHLLLVDEDGKWHQVHGVDAGEQIALEPLTTESSSAATTRFAKLLSEHAPAPPEGMDFNSNENWLLFGRVYRSSYSSGVDPLESRLETSLDLLRKEILQLALPPRTYVAIVDRPQQVAAGIDSVTESQSIHVIQGTW